MYYKEPTLQAIQEQVTNAVDLSKATIALPLKWLMEKPLWVEQRHLITKKLQALEKQVWEDLNAQHTEESTSTWNSPICYSHGTNGFYGTS